MYEIEMWSKVFWTVWLASSNANRLPNEKKALIHFCWRFYWKNSIVLNLNSVCLNSAYSMSVLCSLLDYCSLRDRGKMFEFLFFLSCLFSLCTWHYITFNFTNVLGRQALLICSGAWAHKTLAPSGNLPCWWGVCSASLAWFAGALPLWGDLLWLGTLFAFCWWDAALIHALQGMAGDQAAELAACSAGFCRPNSAVLLLCFLLKCLKHSWRN